MSTTNPTDTITEWEQLQIKYGNFAPRPPTITSEELSNAAIEFAEAQDVLEGKTLNQLDKLEDEVEEDTLNVYRKKRLDELKKMKDLCKFGEVVHVAKADYLPEISEFSKASPDVYVVLHLYLEAKPVCQLINRAFKTLAAKHAYVKFCKAVGSDVIQDLPTKRVPTVLIYKNGVCAKQFLGGSVWGGDDTTERSVERVLWKMKVLRFAADDDDTLIAAENAAQSRKNKQFTSYTRNHSDSSENSEEE